MNVNEALTALIKSKTSDETRAGTPLRVSETPSALPPRAAASDCAALAARMRACRLCVTAPQGLPLPHEPRPIFVLSAKARLVVASQAPGIRAHLSGIPFRDPSGERLRDWLGIGPEVFYDPDRLMILPMGFCFPGHDSAKGDLPPRRECRPAWHETVFAAVPQVETILAIGLHAIRYHIGRLHPARRHAGDLTTLVASWRAIGALGDRPLLIPLPHPSWRNSAWLKRHPLFEAELLPVLRAEVARLTADPPSR